MTPLVYVASPYSHPDPVENTHNAVIVCDELLNEGLVVPVCPHLNLAWQLIRPHDYDTWLAYDIRLLERCDALYRLPGVSKGADDEVQVATTLRLPVFYKKHDVYVWARMLGRD